MVLSVKFTAICETLWPVTRVKSTSSRAACFYGTLPSNQDYCSHVWYTMSKNNLCNETCRIMFIKTTAKSKLNSVNFQLGSLRMAQFVKLPFKVFRLARSIFGYYLNYCLRAQYTIPMNNLCHETCRVMFIKMKATSTFLLAQNTLYSFSSSALNFHGPN